MKSRLLPQPNQNADVDAKVSPHADAEPRVAPARRESDIVDTFDEVAEALAHAAADEASVQEPKPATPRAPEVSARPKGRFFAVAILLVCVGSISYSLWTTFLRDKAYGVVTGKLTEVSAPWTGTLSAVYVREGDQVLQGEVLGIVNDPALQAEIDRLGDGLRTAQAELDAQTALLTLAARDRNDASDEVRANYFDMRGELLAEQARHEELTSKLKRRRELANKRAYSEEEIESLQFVADGLAAKIENLSQATETLESRLQGTLSDESGAQLKPWLAKIEAAQAEIVRLCEKQQRGMIRAPFGGTVVAIPGRVGQRVDEHVILELLPDDSFELQLYVKQADIENYHHGNQIDVVIDPSSEPITCRIVRVGTRLEKPEAHVLGRYRPEEKLVPVHLEPLHLPPHVTLRLGSTVRQPTTLFSSTD